jgi:hypothetical protein
LQWAREVFFEEHFVKDPEIVNNYLEKPDYLNVRNQERPFPF